MASKTTTTWTCDRCGGQVDTSPSATPSSWGRVLVFPGTLHQRIDSALLDMQICAECVREARAHLTPVPEEGDAKWPTT